MGFLGGYGVTYVGIVKFNLAKSRLDERHTTTRSEIIITHDNRRTNFNLQLLKMAFP